MFNLDEKTKYRVFLAAGGNPTGIVQFPDNSRRSEYAQIAMRVMSKDPRLEQFGFLEGTGSFYMSGGEFSGNGARAAAWLIYKTTGKTTGSFTMSGLTKPVNYKILENGDVQCEFLGLQLQPKVVTLNDGNIGTLVDLGGIVHFVFDPSVEFNNEPNYYESVHRKIVGELRLAQKPAVGVVWQKKTEAGIRINPIVWVKDINSFFYETSCGSGALAVLAASGEDNLSIIQPSGKAIQVAKINDNSYSLASEIAKA